ncbi:MAG: glycosyltransferase [Actinomycetes bacterium]
MKIAMVSLHASPVTALVTGDGPAADVASLSAALVRAGHDVTLYVRHGSPGATGKVCGTAGVEVVQIPAGAAKPLDDDDLIRALPDVGVSLAGYLADDEPDLVHAHGWLSGVAALAAARDTQIPVALTLDPPVAAGPDPSAAGETRLRLERALAHSASHLVATSARQKDALVRMGADRRAVSVVPWGVDPERFSPEGPVAPRGRRPRLLHVGSLAEHRGVDDVIRALDRVPDTELVLSGGPGAAALDDDADVARVRALADSLGLSDRVAVYGHVPPADLPALLRSADLFVSLPHDVPFGTAALEAMACGTPVVASTSGGLADVVVDGSTGVLVPPRDPDSLAYALRAILRDPVRREGFGVAAADRARARYGWDRVATDLTVVYAGLVPSDVMSGLGEPDTLDVDVDEEPSHTSGHDAGTPVVGAAES